MKDRSKKPMDKNMPERKNVPYYYHAYNYLLYIAERFIQVIDNPDLIILGGEYKRMLSLSAIVFETFALEAYLNHYGELKIKHWDIIEKRLRFKEKIQLIAEEVGYQINWGVRPFQNFSAIKKYRDQLAHPKLLIEPAKIPLEGGIKLSTEPKNLIPFRPLPTKKLAQLYLEDVKGMIKLLYEAAPLDPKQGPFDIWVSTGLVPMGGDTFGMFSISSPCEKQPPPD